jgi:hypothetical protein
VIEIVPAGWRDDRIGSAGLDAALSQRRPTSRLTPIGIPAAVVGGCRRLALPDCRV